MKSIAHIFNLLRIKRSLTVTSCVLSSPMSSSSPTHSQAHSTPLTDSFGRFHDYLRISLTEKCNLRCVYCMPHEGVSLSPQSKLLTLDERKRVISIFRHLGVRKIRFTGGEPTISNHLVPLVEHARDVGVRSIGITTNGLELGGNKDRIDRLVDAGLTSINISLDSLVPDKFSKISRRDGKSLFKVLSAIHYAASKPQLHVKINCVLMKGVNDNELRDLVAFASDIPVDCRFIEVMPFEGNEWSTSKLMSYHEAIHRIEQPKCTIKMCGPLKLERIKQDNPDPNDTTKWYQSIDLNNGTPLPGRVGFITSMTSHFCNTCNRLRITADGNVKVCLFGEEGLSIRDKLRDGLTDTQIIEEIDRVVKRKKQALGGHSTPEIIASSENRPMILIGG